MAFSEDLFAVFEASMLGVVEVGILVILLRPLEALIPAERWQGRRAVRVDILYTILARVGIIPLAFFFILSPIELEIEALLVANGWIRPTLEQLLPFLGISSVWAFVAYLIVFDFGEYWRHRLQHQFRWWWGLHSLHHSQRHLSFWSDNRNHLIDDIIGAFWVAGVATLVGTPPEHFILALMAARFIESLSHANIRWSFGRVGQYLLVSPRFHRQHHALDYEGEPFRMYDRNFAVLFPIWDILFRTAYFGPEYPATGVRDPMVDRDNRLGWWGQQVLGIRRMLGLTSRHSTHPAE
ncbi:MAG: fatty acid hydroxylase family protein [Alphaproteobacteria bacterium]|nr:MAG: fatty acid hydroxylase family protein [Alphaproteobacteria bacterium]